MIFRHVARGPGGVIIYRRVKPIFLIVIALLSETAEEPRRSSWQAFDSAVVAAAVSESKSRGFVEGSHSRLSAAFPAAQSAS